MRGLTIWPTGDAARFLAKASLFMVGLWLLDCAIAAWLRPVLYEYRKDLAYQGFPYPSGQLMRVEYFAHLPSPTQKVIFAGSSSVANGVDVDIVAHQWREANLAALPLNYGVTSFLASDLAMFRRHLLARDVGLVVYMYNTFSFTEGLHPKSTRLAWDTTEFLHMATLPEVVENLPAVASGLLAESLFVVRFQDLIRTVIDRAAKGTLVPATQDWDYPNNEPLPPPRERRSVTLPDASDWLRQIYLTSDTDEDTLGYRGLQRFLRVAAARKVRVVVMPAPEPEFASWTQYRRGINLQRIDGHVERICREEGALLIPRAEVASFERQDGLFRDHVHLHRTGRNLFSRWLAHRIARVMAVPTGPDPTATVPRVR